MRGLDFGDAVRPTVSYVDVDDDDPGDPPSHDPHVRVWPALEPAIDLARGRDALMELAPDHERALANGAASESPTSPVRRRRGQHPRSLPALRVGAITAAASGTSRSARPAPAHGRAWPARRPP